MQFIAFMLKNFLVITPKLCSMLGGHAQSYAGIIYLSLLPTAVHQRSALTWMIRRKQSNITLGFKLILYKTTNYY